MDDCNHVRLYKLFVILLNIVIAIVGLAMVGFGFTLRFGSETRGFFDINFDTQQFVIGVTVLIVLGIILLVVAGVGYCVVCSGSRGGLRVYAPLVGVPAVLIIAIGAVTYIRSDEVGEQLAEFYRTVYLQYLSKGDPGLVNTLKLFHNALDCCGIGGSLEPFIQDTCPKKDFLDFTMPSCPLAIEALFPSKASLILGCFIGTAVVMTIASISSRHLSGEISWSFSSPVDEYPPYPTVLPAEYGSLSVGVHRVTVHPPPPSLQSSTTTPLLPGSMWSTGGKLMSGEKENKGK